MPRAKSGNPPWEVIAFKLPPDEMQALRRYAEVENRSVSEILRQGLHLVMDIAARSNVSQHTTVGSIYCHTV